MALDQATTKRDQPEAHRDGFPETSGDLTGFRDDLDALHRQAMVGLNTATVAHELNNLLTPMVAFAQLALTKPDRPELTQRALQMAINQGKQAGRVMSALLSFANPNLTGETADVAQCLRSAIQCLGRDTAKDQIEIDIKVPDTKAAVSEVALQQILFNLLNNAVQAMRHQGGIISIEAIKADGGIELTIRDNGPGIPDQNQATLFEPFHKSAHSSGHGLGLYLSRKLARDAEGDLWLASTSQSGTAFACRLKAA